VIVDRLRRASQPSAGPCIGERAACARAPEGGSRSMKAHCSKDIRRTGAELGSADGVDAEAYSCRPRGTKCKIRHVTLP
jgi:hypothetical protein